MTPHISSPAPPTDPPLWQELCPAQGAQIRGGWWGYHTATAPGTAGGRAIASTSPAPTYDYGYYGLPSQP